MYVQRVCRENYTGQIKEETTDKVLPKIIMKIDVLETIDAVTGLRLF